MGHLSRPGHRAMCPCGECDNHAATESPAPSPASPAETGEGREAAAWEEGFKAGGRWELLDEEWYEDSQSFEEYDLPPRPPKPDNPYAAASPAAVPLPEQPYALTAVAALAGRLRATTDTLFTGPLVADAIVTALAQTGPPAAPSLPGEQPGGQR